MQIEDTDPFAEVLNWCAAELGPVEVVQDATKEHAGLRNAAHRLHIPSGYCYLKIHPNRPDWENEVHAYEQWAPAFGNFAPRLLAVRSEVPLALVISELAGNILEEIQLDPARTQAIWRAAGQALAGLHALGEGEYFGPSRRDGSPAGTPVSDARQYMRALLEEQMERGLKNGTLSDAELAVGRRACELTPAFEGEKPVPCHGDYCPANWLVDSSGAWSGAIDFERAEWNVRVVDFTRYPNWDWIAQPDMAEAFFEGYGHIFTPREEQQRLAGHVLYSLSAIVWGMENAYFGFAADGRQAIKYLAKQLT